MKAGGEIAGRCDGKNAWDAVVRTIVLYILDKNIVVGGPINTGTQ